VIAKAAESLGQLTENGRVWKPGRGARWLLALPLAMLAVLFVLPLAIMARQSFSADGGMFSTYVGIATNPALYWPLIYTFWVAALVTLATLILSYPVAFIVSNLKGRWLTISFALILIPFWTSTVIRTYAWIVLLQRRGVLNEALLGMGVIDRPLRLMGTDMGMQIAMVHVMLPFMMLPLLNAFRGIDPVYLRAASVLGANPFRQFLRVYLPLSLPGVSAGCALVFITSLGFYVTPALLGGSQQMAAVMIETQASRLLNWPMASALGTVLLVMTCLLFFIYERALSRLTRSRRP
jgi:ABC-type spermidine/putrescine transport system permease subunit I